MTDQRELDALDRRAARAAADLRARAGARPRPPFEAEWVDVLPAPPPVDGRRSRRPLLVAAAAVVLIAGMALGLVARSGDGDGGVAGPTTTGAFRPFAATELPRGMAVIGAAESPGEQSGPDGDGAIPVDVYGSDGGAPQLGVVLSGELEPLTAGGETFDLGDGRVATAVDSGLPGSTLQLDLEGTSALLISPELDPPALARIAGGVSVERGRALLDEAQLPDDWRFLGTEPDLFALFSPLSISGRTGAPSAAVLYGPVDGDTSAMAIVSSTQGDQFRLDVLRLVSTEVRSVQVRGHDALLATTASADTENLLTVAWLERPGELVRVSGYGLSEDDLLRMAESVEPVEPGAWEAMLREARLGGLVGPDGRPPGEVIGEGTFADGAAWVLRAPTTASEGGDFLSLSVDTGEWVGSGGSSGGSVSSGDATVAGFGGLNTLDQAGRHFLFGQIGAAVTSVELRRADGSVMVTADLVEGQGIRAWVAELIEPDAAVVALDADGGEVDRIEVSDHGSTSTQSAGPTSTTVEGTPGG